VPPFPSLTPVSFTSVSDEPTVPHEQLTRLEPLIFGVPRGGGVTVTTVDVEEVDETVLLLEPDGPDDPQPPKITAAIATTATTPSPMYHPWRFTCRPICQARIRDV
jgi:hypothetical protein